MFALAVAALFGVSALDADAPLIPECPDTLLEGRVELSWDYGPPNYGEDPATDSKERYFRLILEEPVTCGGETTTRVQLVVPDEATRRWLRSNQDRWVEIRGELFGAHTGHHHERLLLDMSR